MPRRAISESVSSCLQGRGDRLRVVAEGVRAGGRGAAGKRGNVFPVLEQVEEGRGGIAVSVIGVEDVQVRAIAECMLAEADEQARVCLAQSALASRTGLAHRTLRRALDRMVQAGGLVIEDAGGPNQPAAYRVDRLREVADEAGWAPRRIEHSGVLRSISAEEAGSPLGSVTPGERLVVAPELLVEEANVRRDLRVDDVFVETVRELGVLKDIDVYPTLTGLVVLDGHRRLAAALAAGVEAVTVRVVEVGSEQERIATQLVENDAHLHTASMERAQAVQQLVLLGMSVKDLRKHGVKPDEVRAAKAVANVPAVKDLAVAQPSVDLVTLGQIAELADGFSGEEGAEDFERVVEEITKDPKQAPFVIAREKRAAERRRILEETVEKWRARGVRAVTSCPERGKFVTDLVDEKGRLISEETHAASCEGHAIFLSVGWNGDVREHELCVDWVAYGHRNRWASPSSGATSGPMSEAQKAERAEIVRKNREGEVAIVVRQGWVRETLKARRKIPADWAMLAAPVMDWMRLNVSEVVMNKGIEALRIDRDLYRAPDVRFRAERGIFYMALAAVEGSFSKSFWRRQSLNAEVMQRLYLRSLEAWGYTLSSLEKEFCEEVESASKVALHAIPKREDLVS